MRKITLKEKDARLVEVIENEGMVGTCWDKSLKQARQWADGDMLEEVAIELFEDEVADFIRHAIQDNVKDDKEKERLLKSWDKANWHKIVDYLMREHNLETWWGHRLEAWG
jgi:hypothetical protein